MELSVSGNTISVRLSRRNLKALLSKLDMPVSARTLYREFDEHMLVIRAEDDDVHYKDRQPGVMHPDTEEAIKEAS